MTKEADIFRAAARESLRLAAACEHAGDRAGADEYRVAASMRLRRAARAVEEE